MDCRVACAPRLDIRLPKAGLKHNHLALFRENKGGQDKDATHM